ncbi:carbohydrate ABC transporter permease [Natronobacterium texcoconense]|uniref:Carbohydrate ABC transporter membrane protein 1, CUT1 family n=1 Tax=Natronobacterium texcoconense TaxID=1095778 RepID=A0A1H1CSI4_NATTX|nr:sugar ABC transporter permease [Natronobacterium texcoconense]SDQ66516.1 carbohydrate ABC transporter membrane protein 1, CUT1 family [Natronobacterium texcoconense]
MDSLRNSLRRLNPLSLSTGDRERESEDAAFDRIRRSDFVESMPFWLPPTLLVLLFVYGAIGWNVAISFTGWSGLGQPDYTNFTLEMYRQMPGDPDFVASLRNTIALLIAFTGVSLVVGLALALLVDRKIRFENTFRTIYLLPMALSFVVTAIFWSWMYASDGLINTTLGGLGLGWLAQDWLGDPRFKLAAVIVALIWQFSGYCMIVYLAGLRSIPSAHYEAARIDGASTLKLYWRVIIPQLRSSTVGATVVLMVFALKAFDFIYVMFGTNPGRSADILAVTMYREAFSASEWAYGAAIAVVLFALALTIIGPYAYTQYKRGAL